MAKYEVMLVLDPREELSLAEKIAKDVFGNGVLKVEKLERTELAYTINKSNTGMFVVMNIETEEANIAEFTRRTNIQKTIWRTLVINLDSEKGLNRKVKPKRVKTFTRKTFVNNNQTSQQGNVEKTTKTNTEATTKVRKTRTTSKVAKTEKEETK